MLPLLGAKAKMYLLLSVLAGSLALSILGAVRENQFWSSPLIAIAVMFWLGELLSLSGFKVWFLVLYLMLIVTSAILLVFTNQTVYWTSPLVLGIVINVLAMDYLDSMLSKL